MTCPGTTTQTTDTIEAEREGKRTAHATTQTPNTRSHRHGGHDTQRQIWRRVELPSPTSTQLYPPLTSAAAMGQGIVNHHGGTGTRKESDKEQTATSHQTCGLFGLGRPTTHAFRTTYRLFPRRTRPPPARETRFTAYMRREEQATIPGGGHAHLGTAAVPPAGFGKR